MLKNRIFIGNGHSTMEQKYNSQHKYSDAFSLAKRRGSKNYKALFEKNIILVKNVLGSLMKKRTQKIPSNHMNLKISVGKNQYYLFSLTVLITVSLALCFCPN